MKKGLSVLLILAALFGFYGGATSLNDVLDCKEYWEEKGKQTTADLNKLEDGINQLKDNEQAYLDGKDTLAEGEKTLADGEAQYAKGLADYEAAPGKLADARKKLAAGEAKLAAGEEELATGEESIDGLTKLIAGINKIRNGYNNDWRPGYEKLKDGRNQIYAGSKGSKENLEGLAAFLPEGDRAGYLAAVEDVTADDKKQTAKDYKTFIKSTNLLVTDLEKIQKSVAAKYAGSQKLKAALSAAPLYIQFAGTVADQKDSLLDFAQLIQDSTSKAKYKGAVTSVDTANTTLSQMVAQAMAAGMTKEEAIAYVESNMSPEQKGQLDAAKEGIVGALTTIEATLKVVNDSVNGEDSDLNNKLLPGLEKFNKAATSEAVDKLSEGQNTIAGGVSTVAGAVLGNKTLKAGVKKNFGSKAIRLLKKYKPSKNPLHTSKANFAAFEKQMDKDPGIEAFLKNAQSLLSKTKEDGQKKVAAGKKELAAGKKKLADGRKQYAQGLKDYEAAPAKLADAEQKLADGRKQLADGKAKLGEYEDGEQQVRDGLATVMGSEANGGLDSILDRRNGDEDFDNGDNHLELDEGLSAVDTARGYQADSGELITEEIMSRAIGTGLSLGAAALACLAALLGLLKKYKGAGVAALLAAAAGCVGIYQGVSAGSEFSSIAGSTVGNMPWIAAGVLAGVAALHAITHFTAKKDA